MKMKSEFVTNSSSASFVVIGTSILLTDLQTEENEGQDNFDILDNLTKDTDLEYSFGCYGSWESDHVMVGIGYTKMGDDETLSQFKSRVKEEIKKAFGKNVEVGHIEDAWEDR